MILLDPVTKASYNALSTAAERAAAVLSAMADPVTVKVYDSTGSVRATGTMQTPWATANGFGSLTLGELGAFNVTSGGTPAGWYLQFESGTRWVRGSLGLAGSGADFTWSLPTISTGDMANLGTAVVNAVPGSTPPPPSDGPFVFAEIPELVFVRGYSETQDLGIFMVDPGNRWAPGDLTRASGWQSSYDVTLHGAVPAGVTLHPRTMQLSYAHAGQPSSTTWGNCWLEAEGAVSRTFRLSVLQPTVTWGVGGAVDPTAIAGAIDNTWNESWNRVMQTRFTPDAINCLLVKGGTYRNKTGTALTWAEGGSGGREGRVYVIGEPGNRPKLEYASTNRSGGLVFTAVTNANPAVFTTYDPHELQTGEQVKLGGVWEAGWTSLNNKYVFVTVIDATSFSATGLDSSGFALYEGARFSITAATRTDPIVITTATPHTFTDGERALFVGFPSDGLSAGFDTLNGTYQAVKVIDATSFSIDKDATNTGTWGAYTSGAEAIDNARGQGSGVSGAMSLRCKKSRQFYIKNLEIDGQIDFSVASGIKWVPSSVDQSVMWGVKVQQTAQEPFSINPMIDVDGYDAIEWASSEAFLVNCHGYNQGRSALSHMNYHHYGSFSDPHDMDPAYTFNNLAALHVNNCYFGASPYGHTLKVECSTAIRNTLVQSADDLNDPTLAYTDLTGYAPVQIHANMRNIMFNNKIDHVYSTQRGQKMTIYVGCRNVNEGGGTLPPYWRDSALASNPTTVAAIKAREAGMIYHGTESTLALYDSAPPSDVPWWNLVGYRPGGDPFNTHTYRTFIAYNTLTVPDVQDTVTTQQFNNHTRHDSSAPHQGLGSFAAQHYFLPVPKNWRNQTAGFLANNVYQNFQASSWHVTDDGFGDEADSLTEFPDGALPYVTTPLTVLSDEVTAQVDAALPWWFPLSFDALPTYPMKTAAAGMGYGASIDFETGLTKALVFYTNIDTGTSDWLMNYSSRFVWIGDEAWWLGKGQFNTKAKVLKYSAVSNSWAQIGPDAPQPDPENSGHDYNHVAYDHVGRKLYFREYNDNKLKILDMDSGAWTVSASMPVSLTISAVAVAWHPHLFDDYVSKTRSRVSDFNGGVVLYAPDKLWAYNPATNAWTTIHDNLGVKYDGNYELSAVYVRSLDAVVFGGGFAGTGKCWRIKHSTATPELLTTAPFGFGANQSSGGVMVDDPDGNGFLLLQKGTSLGNAAHRWWSPDNSAGNGAWAQIGNHPFNVGTPAAHWLPCTNEVDGVVMAICRPVVSSADPVVKLWKPDAGFIPRFRNI